MSATPRATSARRARAAPRSAARTVGMPCSARAKTVSPLTLRTSRSRWLHSMQRSRCAGPADNAACRLTTSTACPTQRHTSRRCSSRARSSPRSQCRRARPRGARITSKCATVPRLSSQSCPPQWRSTWSGARIRQARVALGGVGTKPWRVPQVETALAGASLDPATLRRAAALAAQGAHGRGHNDFKIELMQRAIVRAVETAGARA